VQGKTWTHQPSQGERSVYVFVCLCVTTALTPILTLLLLTYVGELHVHHRFSDRDEHWQNRHIRTSVFLDFHRTATGDGWTTRQTLSSKGAHWRQEYTCMGSCITGANRLLVLLGRQLRAVLRADSWERRGGGVGAGSARLAGMQSSESRSPYLRGIRPSALVLAAQASEAQSRGQSARLVCARERSVCEGRAWTLLSTYARTVPHARLSAAESACTRCSAPSRRASVWAATERQSRHVKSPAHSPTAPARRSACALNLMRRCFAVTSRGRGSLNFSIENAGRDRFMDGSTDSATKECLRSPPR